MKKNVNVVPLLILIGDEEEQVKKVLRAIEKLKPDAVWPFKDTIFDGGMSIFNVKKRNGETECFGIIANVYQDGSCGLGQGSFFEEKIKHGYFIVNCVDFLASAENLLQFVEERSIEVEIEI